MADITDGTYVIVSALNTSRAIDCKGASDESGANVQIYTKNSSDAQFISVVTNSDGSRRLIFPLSGKSIDIANGSLTSGTNVQQYADNSTRAQKWKITADGKTVTIDGTTYNTYTIANFEAQTLVLDVSGGNAASGTNVQIYTANSTDAQRWAFIPANPVAIGTYLIRSALDPDAVLDVSGGSKANEANVQLYGFNETNAQIWQVRQYYGGIAAIYNVGSWKCLNVKYNEAADGVNVQQFAYDGTDACLWFAEPSGSMQINGVTVPTYILHFKTSSGYVIDAANGKAKAGTNVQIYTANGTKAQLWAFQPYSRFYDQLPVPSGIRVSGMDSSGHVIGNNITSIVPIWNCAGTEYQVRYRVRYRKVGKPTGDWSAWKSISDGSEANSGWGDVGSANCITENTQNKVSPTAITLEPVDNASIDHANVQIEVRRFDVNAEYDYQHGNSATETLSLVWLPTLTIDSCRWTPEGIMINYTSDYERDGNTIEIKQLYVAGKLIVSGKRYTGMPYTGEITIPQSELNFIPDDGAAISVNAGIWTDSSYNDAKLSSTIEYNTSSGLTVSPTYTIEDDYTVTVKFTASSEDHVYFVCNNTLMECDGADGIYKAIPPLNTDYEIFVVQQSGSAWGMAYRKFTGIEQKLFIWTWDGGTAIIKLNHGDPPSYADDLSANSTSLVTTGRNRPVYSFGNSIERDLSVSGIYADAFSYSAKPDFEALATAGHTVFRDPLGHIYHTAILSVKMAPTGKKSAKLGSWGTISVEQKEESL